ncbi:MAG: MFS transporter [Actinobacteria bacterium]|nr:MFS transporter [Actinomycetota bacterium]
MKGKIHILIAMFSMQFILSASGAIASPLLPVIGAGLKVSDPLILGLIITLPTLTLIPTNLLSGVLAAKMSKKTLFLIGAVLFIIGGVGPIFTSSIVTFLILRAVMGLGIGFVFPLGFAMLPDYFEGDAQQTASGIFNSGGLLVAVPLAISAGVMGSSDWHPAFWLYALAIIPVVMVLFMIPKPIYKAEAVEESEKAAPPHVTTYIIAVIGLIFFIGTTVATVNNSLFLADLGLPTDQVTGLSGLATALFAVGGFVASLLYGPLVFRLDKWMGPIFFSLGAVGFILTFIFPSPVMLLVCMLLSGISVGSTGPVMVMGAMAKSYWSVPLTTAIVLTGFNLGQFLSPFAVNLFSVIGGGSWPFVFLCAGILIAAIAVYYIVIAVKPERA